MKKKCLYIFILFIFVFCFNSKLEALTCKYEDPFDSSKEIVFEFTREKFDAKTLNSVGSVVNSSTCLDTSKSTFSSIFLWHPSDGGVPTGFSYGNKKWTLESNTFSYNSVCLNEMLSRDGNDDGKQQCPSLAYREYKVKKENYYHVVENSNRDPNNVCKMSGDCIPLVLKSNSSQIIDNGNVSTIDEVKTCNYDLDLSKLKGNGATSKDYSYLGITEWSDSSFTVTLDGEKSKFIYSGEFALDIYSQEQLANFVIYRKNLQSILRLSNPDAGTGLGCLKELFVYWDDDIKSSGSWVKGAYVIVHSRDEIPEGKDFVNSGQHGAEGNYGELNPGEVSSVVGTCVSYLGSASTSGSVAEFLDEIYTIIKILSIIIVIVWSMLDLAKVIVKSKDELMGTVKKCITRLIILIIILLLPTIIDLFGNLFGVDDILCGIK